jgi:hypothetical protein
VQARWLNDGDASGSAATPDPVAGAVGDGGARVPFGGGPPRYATAMRAFVTPRGGGEYLFVPGIAGLRGALEARTHLRKHCSSRVTGQATRRPLGSSDTRGTNMTSREHARRLMLILLSSTGAAPDSATRERRASRRSDASGPEGRDDSTDGRRARTSGWSTP